MYSVLTAGRTLSISHLRSPVFKTEPPWSHSRGIKSALSVESTFRSKLHFFFLFCQVLFESLLMVKKSELKFILFLHKDYSQLGDNEIKAWRS